MKSILKIMCIIIAASLLFLFTACTDGNESDSGKDTASHETQDFGLGIVMPEK